MKTTGIDTSELGFDCSGLLVESCKEELFI